MNENEFERDNAAENADINENNENGYEEPRAEYTSAEDAGGAEYGTRQQSGTYYGGSYYGGHSGQYSSYNAGSGQYGGGRQYGSYNNQSYGGYTNPSYSSPAPPVPPDGEKKGMGRGAKATIVIIALLAAAAVIAIILGSLNVGGGGGGTEEKPSGDAPTLGISENQGEGEVSADGVSSVEVAEEARKSVVGITAYLDKKTVSQGSGIIMESDDPTYTYIVTCAHVINMNHTSVEVQLHDERTFSAEVVGYSTRDDVGVLKVKAKGLPAAKFADSDDLKVGERVYAIGNPGGAAFFGSFTGGFVSAIDRPISTSSIGYTMKCIQHDAAINPGNSGGALVNSNGYVVGINSSKIMAKEYEGMAFAIPISSAKEIIDSILANGYVPNQPKLGIKYMGAYEDSTYSMIVQIKKLPAGTIVVREIQNDSSLKNTELQVGDMITAVNGKDMTSSKILAEIIEDGKVGDELTLTICRVDNDYNISEFTVKAKLVEDKSDADTAQNG